VLPLLDSPRQPAYILAVVSTRQPEFGTLKIVVCIKRVPDTESRIRIAGDGTAIDRAGIKFVISPYDEYALELALRLKESGGGGEITVITVGDASSTEQLRSALAMGADRAVRLDGEPGMDGLATAKALADSIREIAPDLVLAGMKATDDDQQQVGPMLAALLDIPSISVVASFDVANGRVSAHREIEGGVEHVLAPLPALLTITKTQFEPRLPRLQAIMAAKKKPLEEKPANLQPSRIRLHGLAYPPERPPGRIVGNGADAVSELVRLLREEAKVL
jgi:electron transfer flavoprotein beta subunit